MRKLLLLIAFSLPCWLQAQEKKARFHSILSPGIIIGQGEIKSMAQFSAGITYYQFYTGIGVGYDPYKFNSVPIYADWRVYIGRKRIGFLYGQLGYNIPGSYKKEEEFSKIGDRMKAGFYADAGIGFRIPAGPLHRFSFSAGYSYKEALRKKTYSYGCGLVPCTTDNSFSFDYRYGFERIVVKAGWEFGK